MFFQLEKCATQDDFYIRLRFDILAQLYYLAWWRPQQCLQKEVQGKSSQKHLLPTRVYVGFAHRGYKRISSLLRGGTRLFLHVFCFNAQGRMRH